MRGRGASVQKGRTKAEVDEVISWLTGYSARQLQRAVETKVDFEALLARAPRLNPNVKLITGVVCSVRIENAADPLMQNIRALTCRVAAGRQVAFAATRRRFSQLPE